MTAHPAGSRRLGPPTRHHIRNRTRLVGAVTAIVLAVAGGTCVGVVLTHQRHPADPPLTTQLSLPPTSQSRAVSAALVMDRSQPTSLSIPSIGVISALLVLGQTAGGAIQVPAPGPDYNRAGWYRYSPTPGSLGPAVIVGHIDSAAGGPSVFFHLGGLKPHALVQIDRADGTVAVFEVDAVRRYSKAAFPTQLVYGNTDDAALRLITCGGSFDTTTGHYRDNIVVFATLIRSR